MIIDAELDICPAYGWQGGPEFNTLITQLRSGVERRRSLWVNAQHRYILPFQNITDAAYLTQLKMAYLSAMGSAHSFRVKDFSDYQAENAIFGVGDGVTTVFDLGIVATFGDAAYTRRIVWPVAGAVYTVDGTPASATFDYDTGQLTFDVAPADTAVLRWTGEFRVLVRFASDAFPMSIDNISGNNFIMNGSVELKEVFA